MRRPNRLAALEIGDRPGHTQDAVVRTRRQAEFVHRGFQQVAALVIERAELAKLPAAHSAVEAVVPVAEAAPLRGAGLRFTCSRITALDVPSAPVDNS